MMFLSVQKAKQWRSAQSTKDSQTARCWRNSGRRRPQIQSKCSILRFYLFITMINYSYYHRTTVVNSCTVLQQSNLLKTQDTVNTKCFDRYALELRK